MSQAQVENEEARSRLGVIILSQPTNGVVAVSIGRHLTRDVFTANQHEHMQRSRLILDQRRWLAVLGKGGFLLFTCQRSLALASGWCTIEL